MKYIEKINSLNDSQVAEFSTYREKWRRIALSTEPTDIPATEAAVRQFYELAGLSIPQSIIYVDSPLSAFTVIDGETLLSSVWNGIANKIRTRVLNNVWDQVWSQVGSQPWLQVGERVWNHLWDKLFIEQGNIDHYFIDYYPWYGCHQVGLLSVYDYFREVCGLVKETEKLPEAIAISKCCGWWAPYGDVLIIQNRPCFIGFDDDERLHCNNGMAIRYRDGFGVWAINGIMVDEQIVMKPSEQTIQQISEEDNAEKKRVRIERFGWNRYLTEIGAKVIDRRHNDIENTLETLVRTSDGMVILLPTCKTGRLFSLEVPSDILTCEQAQSWLHGGSELDRIVGNTRVIGRS